MRSSPYRVALIGLGAVAQRIHLPACALLSPVVEVVAGCDLDPATHGKFTQRFGTAKAYLNYPEMLSAASPDLVIVGTPPTLHFETCRAALQAGAHVLCEKPFANSLQEADSLIECARRHGRVLRVNNQYRYMQHYASTQRRLVTGEFGRLLCINVWQQMMHPPAVETNWRKALSEYVLFEFGTHVFDLLHFFFGCLPDSVFFRIPRCQPDYDSDVVISGLLDFPGERIATLLLNRISHAKRRYLEMRLDCERASIRISLGGVARLSVDFTNKTRIPVLKAEFVKGGQSILESEGQSRVLCNARNCQFAPATAENMRLLLKSARSVEQGEPIDVHLRSVELSRDILAMVFAGYESARTRQVVHFDKAVASCV